MLFYAESLTDRDTAVAKAEEGKDRAGSLKSSLLAADFLQSVYVFAGPMDTRSTEKFKSKAATQWQLSLHLPPLL